MIAEKAQSKGFYHYLEDFWKAPLSSKFKPILKGKIQQWYSGSTITRVEIPTRLDKARRLGYKAKPGYVVVRARIRRASGRHIRPSMGRKPSKMGVIKLKRGKNLKWIAEERANKKYPNLEVLNSYWIGQDGKYKYYEVILIDPHSTHIINDKKINWICSCKHKGRVYRGLTSAGKKARK